MGDEEQPGAGHNVRPAVAVLPFTCIGDVSRVAPLADGINEDLRVSLGRYGDLPVIGMQSVHRYRDTASTIDEIARELDARFIVSGSVRKLGDTLRMAVELVDTAESNCLWSDTIQRSYTVHGLLEIEEEIAHGVLAGISKCLGTTLTPIRREPRGKPPQELSAYEASFLYCHYNAVHGQEAHQRACEALERAIEDDPDYALARAQLGELYCDVYGLGYQGPDDVLAKARACAERAVELDNICQHARLILAYVEFLEGNHPETIHQAEMAIALNPNVAHLVGFAGYLIALSGGYDNGCAIIDEMETLNPHQPGWMRMPAIFRAVDQGEYETAWREARRIRFAQLGWDPLLRAATGALADKRAEAAAAYREFSDLYPELAEDPEPYVRAFIHDGGHVERILEGLETAKEF